jgi:hypothetical protein
MKLADMTDQNAIDFLTAIYLGNVTPQYETLIRKFYTKIIIDRAGETPTLDEIRAYQGRKIFSECIRQAEKDYKSGFSEPDSTDLITA